MVNIKLTETDVDGCGSDVSVIIQVNAPSVTLGTVERIKDRIEKFKTETEEWCSDDLFGEAEAQLKEEGFEVTYIVPEIEIEF